jgi:hypothetical protein
MLVGHIAASMAFQRQLSLPDPIDLADLSHADPSLLHGVISRRVSDGRFPRNRVTVKWPKGFDPAAFRLLTALDVLDQLGYRLLVSGAADALARRAPRSIVAHRVTSDGGAWRSIAAASKERRTTLLDRFERRPTLWLAKLDVKNYFASLPDAVLADGLRGFGVAGCHVESIVAFRSSFDDLPGNVMGLPIGPEGSAVLGTIGLHSLDRLLAPLEHFRLVDDVWLVAESEAEALGWAELVADGLRALGMSENEAKRQILTGFEAIEAISDSEIDYALSRGGNVSVREAVDLVLSATEDSNLSRLRFGLGALSRHPGGGGAATVLEHPHLIEAEPAGVGRFLRSIAADLSVNEVDELVARACGESGEHGLAGRIHIAHALGKAHLVDEQRQRLLEAASITSDRRLQPLSAHLVAAGSSRSRSKACVNRAVELAEVTDNLDLRRSALHSHRVSQVAHHEVIAKHLVRLEPDLAPFASA